MSIWRCVASNTPFSTRFLSPYLCWRKLKSEAYVKCFHRSFLYDTEGVILQDSLNTKSSARNRNRDQQYRFLPEVAGAIMEHWASGIFVVGEWTSKVNAGRAEDWPQTQTADWRGSQAGVSAWVIWLSGNGVMLPAIGAMFHMVTPINDQLPYLLRSK